MSGTQVSPYGDANFNSLYNTAALSNLSVQRNQLQMQEAQQQLAGTEAEYSARAAQGILSMPDPAQRAAAWPQAVASLQRMGMAKNAPAQYPGDAVMQRVVQMAMPIKEQYEYGLVMPPGLSTALQRTQLGGGAGTAPTAAPAAPSAATAPAATTPAAPTGVALGMRQNNPGNLQFAGQPYAQPTQGNRFATFPDMPTGVAATADQLAINQQNHGIDTVRKQVTRWVSDPKADLTSYITDTAKALGVGPDDKVDFTDPNVQRAFILAQQPHESAGGGAVLSPADVEAGVKMAAARRGQTGYVPAGQPQVPATPAYIAAQSPRTGGVGSAATTGAPAAPPPAPVRVAGPGAPTATTAPPPPPAPALSGVAAVQLAGAAAAKSGNPTRVPIPGSTDVVLPNGRPVPDSMVPAGTTIDAAPALPQQPAAPAPAGTAPAPTQQAAAVPPAPQQAPAAPAPGQANLPHYWQVPSGTNAPQLAQAQQLLLQAQQLEPYAAVPGAGGKLAQQRIADLKAQAQTLMQTDSIVQTQEGQYHTLTGQLEKAVPNFVYDPQQHAWIDTRGGSPPTFEPAQRDSAVALRTIMENGPKVANGTATSKEISDYNAAVPIYTGEENVTSPISKELVSVRKRQLPAGFPDPSATGGAGGAPKVILPGLSPAQQEIERDPAAYKVNEAKYDRDSKEIASIGDAGRQAQADQIQIKEMQDVLKGFTSGPGTAWRTAASAWLQRWAPAFLTGWEKESANLTGAEASQVFSKLALTAAGQQERGVLGNRGGYQAIRMFREANPSVNLLDPTNESILNMRLISNQANADYAQDALTHFTQQEDAFAKTHKYESLAQFDQQWNAKRNPQVYSAAMGAVSGQDASQWAKGLSDAEYGRALEVIARAKPGVVVNGKSGPIVVQPPAAGTGPSGPATPAIGAVQNGYRYKGGDPAQPTSWEKV